MSPFRSNVLFFVRLRCQVRSRVKSCRIRYWPCLARECCSLDVLIWFPSCCHRVTKTIQSSFMSSLAKDAAAFKSTLQRQDTTSWHSHARPDETSNEPAPSVEPSNSPTKKKRPKSSKKCLLFFRPMTYACNLKISYIPSLQTREPEHMSIHSLYTPSII